MKTAGVIALIAVTAWGGHRLWQGHERAQVERKLQAVSDAYGFVPVRMPDGAPQNTVLVLAPVNCPSDGAQRADSLAAKLQLQGIPTQRANQYSIAAPSEADRDGIERAFMVMNGAIPAVMINGQAKANPTLDEVTAEFHRFD